MKKAFIWILGISVVLLAVAFIFGAGYLVVKHWGSANWMMRARSFEPFDGERVRPYRDVPQFEMPMHPGWDMPMSRRGWTPFMRFGGFFPLVRIFGGLCWTVLVILAVVGVISLVRSRKSNQMTPVAAAPMPVAATEEPAVVEPPSQAATCANCSQNVQDDWSHCPYCGYNLK